MQNYKRKTRTTKKGVSGIVFKLPYHNERKDSTGNVVSDGYNTVINAVAKEKGLAVFDVNGTELNFIDDNVHFTDVTQKGIAELFLKIL